MEVLQFVIVADGTRGRACVFGAGDVDLAPGSGEAWIVVGKFVFGSEGEREGVGMFSTSRWS